MKKIYIAGCAGMLGEAFYEIFKNDYIVKASDIDVSEKWLTYLDFRSLDHYKKEVIKFEPDYLVHLGALTSLEDCDNDYDNAFKTNTLAVENATIIANEFKIPIIYISTAGIFDGKKNLYDDWDLPNPQGNYAISKYQGELYVEKHANRFLVLRAGWMMGGGPRKDKKFVQKIIKQIKDGNKELNIVNDKFGTPTYTIDFAENAKLLIKKKIWGIYNLVCEGESSRMDVAIEILKNFQLENKIKINSVDSNFFKKEYFSFRPASERLLNSKLNLRDLNLMRNWKICLKEYIEHKYKNYF